MTEDHELIYSTAVTAAVALAEYGSLYDLLGEASALSKVDQEAFLQKMSPIAQEQALMLLLLARSVSEYGKNLKTSPRDDPRLVLPLLQEIGASYALLALSKDSSQFQADLLLSPDKLEELLSDEVTDFLSRWGEERAVALLEKRRKLYEEE